MMSEEEAERIAKAQKAALKHLLQALEDYHKEILDKVIEMERLADMIEQRAQGSYDG